MGVERSRLGIWCRASDVCDTSKTVQDGNSSALRMARSIKSTLYRNAKVFKVWVQGVDSSGAAKSVQAWLASAGGRRYMTAALSVAHGASLFCP